MKVILKENIKKIGKKGEIKDVPDGHARNFLIPRKLVVVATDDEIKKLENSFNIKSKNEENKIASEKNKFNQVEGKVFEIKSNSNNEGVLFAAVDSKKISEVTKLDLPEILLEENIKKVGDYEVKIKVGNNDGNILLKIA